MTLKCSNLVSTNSTIPYKMGLILAPAMSENPLTFLSPSRVLALPIRAEMQM